MSTVLATADVVIPKLNYWAREWLDPVASITQGLGGERSYIVVQQLIFFLGCYTVLRFTTRYRGPTALAAGCVLYLVTTVSVGVDPFVAKFQWFPFLFWALQSRPTRAWHHWAISVVLVFLWSLTGGGLAFYGLILVSLFQLLRGERVSAPLFLFGLAVALVLTPVFPMPEYPPGARLTPVTPLAIEPLPLVGTKLVPNPLLFDALWRETLPRLCLGVISFALLLACFAIRGTPRAVWLPIAGGCGAITLLLVLERWFSAPLFPAMPLRVLMRVVPGLALNPLPWLVWALFLFCAAVFAFARARAVDDSRDFVLLSLVMLFLLAAFRWGGNDYAVSSIASPKDSPSRFVAEAAGKWVLSDGEAERRREESLVRLVPNRDFRATVKANVRGEYAQNAADGDRATEWKTGRPQRRGDALILEFNRPLPVLRIELQPGGGGADFPRGILAEGSTDGAHFEPIFNKTEWFGPIRWSAKGDPYFGPQSEVFLDLPTVVVLQYLRLTLLRDEGHFDWSVSEVRLFSPRDAVGSNALPEAESDPVEE